MEMEENKEYGRERDEIFSKAVRAGKRTYFFDVKSTRKNDYYLTITEVRNDLIRWRTLFRKAQAFSLQRRF